MDDKMKKAIFWIFVMMSFSAIAVSSTKNNNRFIMTVNGIIRAESFGKALVHEHIICDFIGADKVQKNYYDSNDVISTMLPYLQEIQKQGFTGFVDCTPTYIGRNVQVLHKLSELTGLHILTNTGYYGAADDKFLPSHTFSETEEELASRWIKEWENGIDDTNIKPGFIKIGIDPGHLSKIDRKIVRAASKAYIKTGLPIACHTGEKTAALEVLNVIISEGVDPSGLIIVHADSIQDVNTHLEIAGKGAWIEYDGIGNRPIEEHVKLIKEMIRAGYLNRLLLSHDAGWYQVGEPKGGEIRLFTVIENSLIPKLKLEGIDDKMLKILLVDNPANAFTIRNRNICPNDIF
jgi:phosphotriesterase-related protein